MLQSSLLISGRCKVMGRIKVARSLLPNPDLYIVRSYSIAERSVPRDFDGTGGGGGAKCVSNLVRCAYPYGTAMSFVVYIAIIQLAKQTQVL
jgi:hypothetical protein